MQRTKLVWMSIGFALLLFSSDLFGQEQCRFDQTLPVTGQYVMEMTTTTDMTTQISEKKIASTGEQKQIWSYVVTPKEQDGLQKVQLRLTKIVLNNQVDGKNVLDFETGNPDKKNEILGPVYEEMMKANLVGVYKDGQAKSFSGFNDMWDAMQKNAEGPQKQIYELFKKEMNDDKLAKTFSTSNQFYPKNKSVKVGENWVVELEQEIPIIGKLKGQFKCKLAKIETRDGDPIAFVEMTGDFKTAAADFLKEATTGAIKLKKLDMTITGRSEFNTKTGVTVINTSDTDLEMEMEIANPQKPDQKQSFTTGGKTKAVITMKSAK